VTAPHNHEQSKTVRGARGRPRGLDLGSRSRLFGTNINVVQGGVRCEGRGTAWTYRSQYWLAQSEH